MRFGCKYVGWGMFKVDGKLCVWDDYEDDFEHGGYGRLVFADGSEREIVKIERDINDRPMAFVLA